MKICSKCGVEKDLLLFYKSKRSLYGVRADCKACCEKIQKEKNLLNREKIKEKSRRYYLLHAEKIRSKTKEWQRLNPEKVKSGNAKHYFLRHEENKARSRLWAKENPHKNRLRRSRRRATEANATPKWVKHDKIAEFYFAANFLGMATGDFYHVDHIVPLKSKYVCGLHCEANLRVLPALENLKKSNRYWPDMP